MIPDFMLQIGMFAPEWIENDSLRLSSRFCGIFRSQDLDWIIESISRKNYSLLFWGRHGKDSKLMLKTHHVGRQYKPDDETYVPIDFRIRAIFSDEVLQDLRIFFYSLTLPRKEFLAKSYLRFSR